MYESVVIVCKSPEMWPGINLTEIVSAYNMVLYV